MDVAYLSYRAAANEKINQHKRWQTYVFLKTNFGSGSLRLRLEYFYAL